MRTQTAFTLVELVIVIAIAAMLLAAAVPSYRNMMASNRLTAHVSDYVLAVNEARLEAIRRNTTTQICAASGNGSGDLATACASAGAGAIFALPSDPDDDPVMIRAAQVLPPDIQLVNFQALRYTARGFGRAPNSTTPYVGRVADLYASDLSSDSHRCVYMTTGTSLKTCATNATCDANTEPTDCQ